MKKSKNLTWKKFFRYAIVGGSGSVLSWGIVYGLTEWCHLWYMASVIITTFVIVTYNYILNALWTFREV